MRDRAFGMLRGHIGMTGLAMFDGFLQMLDPFIQMRILHPARLGMLECFFSMLHQGIGMALFAMSHRFLGMFKASLDMLVASKGEPTEQRDTNERCNRRNRPALRDGFSFSWVPPQWLKFIRQVNDICNLHRRASPYTAIF